ncbi:DUF2851 family protein [Mucilaginibacter terrae]|uniref:DUF2851 family protein n=1 Tax=Mucilaginibacter terrae TaxID=1955052 RepID=A0ABU3GS01_9SPHI|nr:DUF2851 family protein [Mucilaginibacter terrae]MDT3402541.1 hypothetical protein [Mucilaginibacter terrae]
MLFTEDFLHYLWKFKLFDMNGIQTTEGEMIEILSAGIHNFNSGADFQNARLRIGDTEWAGNVEIHLASSDWHKHHHTHDKAYNNVILHVVYQHDEDIAGMDGKPLPTLQLHNRIPADLYLRYHNLAYGKQQIIPCEGSIGTVKSMAIQNWLTRVLVERLQKKSEAVIERLKLNKGDWEETFYQFLAANFGFKVNALPFELLAKSLPQNILAKNKHIPLQVEALIFGQAGFLQDDFTDEYPQKLKTEYAYLQKKYNLSPVEKHLWKFMRLRPQNFPTIRLAQFATLVLQANHLFSKILETTEVPQLRKLFGNIVVNDYWLNHYRFDAESKSSAKSFGDASVDLLLLNTVSVFLYSYGSYHQQQKYIDRSLELLENLPVEHNHIVDDFYDLGVKAKTAFESQALLELRNSYCNHKKCLQCGVGNEILKFNVS